MSWITYDYGCDACGHVEDHLLRRDEVPETVPCPACGEPAHRMATFGSTMRAALPDGTKRFSGIREQRALQKLERKARRSGDKDTVARAARERAKLNGRA